MLRLTVHTNAGVGHGYADIVVWRNINEIPNVFYIHSNVLCTDGERTTLWHESACIDTQIQNILLNPAGITDGEPEIFVSIDAQGLCFFQQCVQK